MLLCIMLLGIGNVWGAKSYRTISKSEVLLLTSYDVLTGISEGNWVSGGNESTAFSNGTTTSGKSTITPGVAGDEDISAASVTGLKISNANTKQVSFYVTGISEVYAYISAGSTNRTATMTIYEGETNVDAITVNPGSNTNKTQVASKTGLNSSESYRIHVGATNDCNFYAIKFISSSTPTPTTKTLYINGGGSSLWNQAGAKFSAYYWTDGNNATSAFLTKAPCGDDNTYVVEVPTTYKNIIFIRNKDTSTEPGFGSNDDNYWNKTGDLTIPTDSKNQYTITGWGNNTNVCLGSWGAYSVPTYSITFNGNGNTDGSMSKVENIACGSNVTLTANGFSKAGYSFNGWKDAGGTFYADEATISNIQANYTLTAQWTGTTPTFSAQPKNATYTKDATATALSVTASANGGSLSYQWQSSSNGASGWTNVSSGGTSSTYTPSTATIGDMYYRCIVTNTTGNKSATSDAAKITVETIKYATSLNFEEQAAKGGDIATFLATGNMTISSTDGKWDSSDAAYKGWKINTENVTITFWVQAGKQLTIELGEKTEAKVSLNGGTESTLSKSTANPCGIMSVDTKVVIRTTSTNTTSIQKITISAPVVTTTWYVYGQFKGETEWTNHNLTNGQYTVTLDKNSSYDFKVRKNVSNVTDDVYYGASDDGNSYNTSGAEWTLDGTYNVHLKTAAAGSYIFNVITTNANPQITITYPAAYTVTFDIQGHGTAPEQQTNIASGEKAVQPATPADVEGWHFAGWYKEATCTNVWDFDTETISANTTIYAKWVKKVKSITLSQAQGIYEMQVADKLKLTLTASPDDAEYGTEYTWNSSNTSLITVDQDGVVTAKAVGSGAYIYVTNNDGVTSNHYVISVVSGECTGHWSVHMWNNDNWTNRHLCFTQVGSTNTWITQQTVLPSNSNSERIKVLYDNADGHYTKDWATRYVVTNGYRDGKCTDVSDGNRYPGQDAIGYFRIYDNSTDENYFLSFEPIYAIRYGSGDNWTITNFNSPETANNYYTDLWQVPNNYTSIQIYAGARTENNVNSIDGRSETVGMNTITGLTAANLAGTYGKFKINDNYCNKSNFNLQFIPYYVVELYNNGALFGERQSSLASAAGKVVFSVPEAPTGYDFGGWQRENDTYIVKPSDADWTNYGMWKSYERFNAVWTPQTYTITYKDQGGADFSGTHGANHPTSHTYGTATQLVSPTKDGYTFDGWFGNMECSGSKMTSVPANGYTQDFTLYAKWTEIKVTSITASPTSLDIKKGESADVTLTITPATALNKEITIDETTITTTTWKSGTTYTVTGKTNGEEKDLKFKNSNSGEQVTVKVKVYYLVEFNTNGAATINSVKWYSSENDITLQTPSSAPSGKTFDGWYLNSDFSGTKYTAGTEFSPSDNCTLYAKWTQDQPVGDYATTIDFAEEEAKTKSGQDVTTISKNYSIINKPSGATVQWDYQGKDNSGNEKLSDRGLKLKGAADIQLSFTVPANSNVTITLGYVSGLSINQNGGEFETLTGTSSSTATPVDSRVFTSTEECTYIIKTTSTGGYNIIKAITITSETPCTAPTASWTTEPDNLTVGGTDGSAKLNTNYPAGITWSSNPTGIVNIVSNGVDATIHPVKAGTTTITATVTGDGTTYCQGPATATKTITVTAAPVATYTITINPHGGSTSETGWTLSDGKYIKSGIASGTKVTLPTLTKSNCEFVKWTNNIGDATETSPITVTSDITLYANWHAECPSTMSEGGEEETKTFTYDFEATNYLSTYFDIVTSAQSGHTYGQQSVINTNIKTSDLTNGGTYSLMGTISTSNVSATYTTKESYSNIQSIKFYENANDNTKPIYLIKVINPTTSKEVYTSTQLDHKTIKGSQGINAWSDQYTLDLSELEDPVSGKVQLVVNSGSTTKYYAFDNITITYKSGSGPTPVPGDCHYITYRANAADATGITVDETAYNEDNPTATIAKCGYTREGYNFVGWNTDEKGEGTSYTAGQTKVEIDADLTLYAVWAEIPTCQPHGLAYSIASVNKTFGDGKFTNELSNSHALTVSYTSSDVDVAIVNSSTGEVEIKGVGTTTITAYAAEQTMSSTTYCEGSATYTLAVAKANPNASFSNGNYTIGGTALDLSNLFSSPSTGAVTYSITAAGTTGATLSGSNFSATAAGTATVQASQAADDNYNAVTKTATITVTAASGGECEEIGYGTATPITLNASSGSLQLAAVGSSLTSETQKTPFSGAEQCNWIKGFTASNYITANMGGSEIDEVTISMATENEANNVCAIAFSSSTTFDASTILQCYSDKAGNVHTFTVNTTSGERSTMTMKAPAGAKSFAISRNLEFTGYQIVTGDPTYTNSKTRYLYYIQACPTASSCTPPATTAITGETQYEEGNTIRLTAEYTGGSGTPTYQWLKNGVAIYGATGQIYSKENSTTDDAGYYSCEITLGGSCSKTTFATQVVVKGETCVAPVITTQPNSVSDAKLGSTITFTTAATGAAFYQWYTCDNQGNNLDPIEGANAASFTIPTGMQKVATSYFRCRAIAACGEDVLTNTVFASIVPIEFTINYGVYVANSAISSADEYAAFTQSKVVAEDAKPYIKDAGLENISFHGSTTKPSGNGDGSNWSPVIAVPSSSSAEEYTEFSFFIERDFQINITEITLPVMLTTAGETHFTATLTDEIGTTINGSLTLSTASQTGEISFDLSDEVNLVGKVTVKLSVYGKSYRIGKNIFLKGELTSLPTPTIQWTSEALMPKSGNVTDDNAQIKATTNATGGATISYRSEQTNIADIVEDNGNYYVDYKTAGIANIIATVTGDGIHWNSNPPHSVSVNINVECTSPELAWATAPANLQVGGSNGSASVTINSGTSVPEGLTLSFESSNEAIATVAQNGMSVTITPVSAGQVAISATLVGDGKYYCTSATTVQQTITVAPAAGTYTVKFEMNGATARDNASWNTGAVNEVIKPTRTGYTFTGWTVSQGLVPASAKWGTTSTPATAITTCSDLCNNVDGSVYFKDLAAAGGSVTLTANWKAVCQGGTGGAETTLFYFAMTTNQTGTFTPTTGKSAVLKNSSMASDKIITIDGQKYYKLNSSSNWIFTLADGDTFAEGDVITVYTASSVNGDAKALNIAGESVSNSIQNGKVTPYKYTVTSESAIKGKNSFTLSRIDSEPQVGIVTVTRGGSAGGDCVYVTYKVNDGDVTGNVQDNNAYTASTGTITLSDGTGFSRSGYTLEKWNTSANGDGTSYNLSAEINTPANNLTLYAVWASNTRYTMIYNANGGSGTMTDDKSPYNPGSTVIVMANTFTAPDGKEFVEWNTADDGSGTAYSSGDDITIEDNMTLYAQWKDQEVAQTWTISYVAGEGVTGDVPESAEVRSGDTYELPDEGNLTKTNYSFTGWNDGEKTYTAGQDYTMPNHDVTFTAQWKINKESDCKNPTLGTYTFEGNETVGNTTKAKAEDHKSAFKIDNMSFSAMNAVFEDGTGNYGGWKIKTSGATIEFCVEEECEVSVRLGSIGNGSGMTITYTKPGESGTTTTSLTANATKTYAVAEGTTITLTTTGSNTVTLKEIHVGDKCEMAPSYTDVYAYVKENVTIAETNKVLIGTVQLNGKYTLVGSVPATEHGLIPVYDSNTGDVYVYGTPENTTDRGLVHEVPLSFQQKGCDEEYEVILSVIICKANAKKIAYVIDGTKNGAFTAYNQSRLSDALYNKLMQDFEVTPMNAYASVDSVTIATNYAPFDVVVLTDYPNTAEKTNNVSYSNMLGTLVDNKPVLTMEAFVSNLSKWSAKGLTSDPINPSGDDKTNVMTLLCNANDIFGTGKSEHFKAGSQHTVTTDLTDPCLQGFAPMEAPDFVFIGSINANSKGTLITCCERQHNPAARMVVLGMQQKVYPKISDCGYDIVKGLINYLTKTDPASIPDCSVIFNGEGGDSNWSTTANWEGNVTPDHISPVRIDAPCVVDVNNAQAGSIKIHKGTANEVTYNGSIKVNPGKALAVSKSISRIEGGAYSTLLNTEADDIQLLADEANGSGALIIGAEEGTNQATMQLYSKSREENGYYYWQYIGFPSEDINLAKAFPGGYLYQQKETTDGYWTYITSGKAEAFGAYGISLDYKGLYTYTGHLVPTTDKEINLTYSACEGINMIGNSWTAPIQITKMETTDFGEATPTIYIYNTGNDEEAGGGDGVTVEGDKTGTWSVIPISATKNDIWKGKKTIPSMQAFEVHTATPTTLTLDYSRIAMPEANTEVLVEPLYAPVRKQAAERHTSMRIVVTGQNKMADLYLFEGENFSETYDRGWDGDFVEGDDNTMQFYSTCALGNMAVNALPDLEGLPIIFKPLANVNNYTISFNQYGNDMWYFNDIKTQTSTLIDPANTYQFTTEKGDDANRFYISRIPFRTTPTDYETLDEDAENTLKKIIYKEHLYIIRQGRLFDGQGKLVK